MSGTKRKIFGAEFKAKVGLEAINGVKTVNQIAQDHGVHPTQVGQWKKEILERAGSLFEGTRGLKPVNGNNGVRPSWHSVKEKQD